MVKKIAIGSLCLLLIFEVSMISMSLGGLFYILSGPNEDIINGDFINMLKVIPVGAFIFIGILLLWFGISYIIGTIYIKLKKNNF